MCSKTDSDATYCTEVKEMLTALKKSSTHLLRRSQRLSQKLVKSFENNEKSDQKPKPSRSDVPLDLSHKSKESPPETPQLELDEAITIKNVRRAVKINDKDIGGSQNRIYKNESQRRSFRKGFVDKKTLVISMQTAESFEANYCNKTKPSKSGRKRKYKSGEVVSQPNNHIEVSAKTNRNTSNHDADFNKNNNFQSKIEQVINEKRNKKQTAYTTSNKIKPNRTTRSQTRITNKKLCGPITKNTNFGNEHKKLKTEKLSQKSYETGILISNCLEKIPSAVANRICSQCLEYKCSSIENKHENQGIKETLHCLEKVEVVKENCQKEIQSKNAKVNKNYLKSFDKNQFLDKIRNARSYVDSLSVENNNLRKINTFDIPPSPAESEDLLKKSILLNPYPVHFKHQLPLEAILTSSLDPQALPTPDETVSSELLDSSSSSPSLPESLCELFKTKDIKHILNLEQTSYHLNSYHVQALALMLNLQMEYLRKLLDKVINTSPAVLKNIEKAVKTPFLPDNDLFSSSSNELWNTSNAVPNSQSPRQRKISCGRKY